MAQIHHLPFLWSDSMALVTFVNLLNCKLHEAGTMFYFCVLGALACKSCLIRTCQVNELGLHMVCISALLMPINFRISGMKITCMQCNTGDSLEFSIIVSNDKSDCLQSRVDNRSFMPQQEFVQPGKYFFIN